MTPSKSMFVDSTEEPCPKCGANRLVSVRFTCGSYWINSTQFAQSEYCRLRMLSSSTSAAFGEILNLATLHPCGFQEAQEALDRIKAIAATALVNLHGQ